jgi:hypothetical protein
LGALLACAGKRACLACGLGMQHFEQTLDGPSQRGVRQTGLRQAGQWQCPRCGATAP